MKKYSLFIEYNNKRYYFMKFNFSVGNSTCFKYSFTKDVNQTLYCDTEGEVLSVFDEAFKTDKGLQEFLSKININAINVLEYEENIVDKIVVG